MERKQIAGFPTNMLRIFCTGFLSVSFGGACTSLVCCSLIIRIPYFLETFLWLSEKTKSFGYLYLLNKVFSIFTP